MLSGLVFLINLLLLLLHTLSLVKLSSSSSMACLFLNPPTPPPSNLFSLKKNPTSTTTFSRYPLVKNPNLSLFRPPKTNSLKFSANNKKNQDDEFEQLERIILEELDKRDKIKQALKKFLENESSPGYESKNNTELNELITSLLEELGNRDKIITTEMVKYKENIEKYKNYLEKTVENSYAEFDIFEEYEEYMLDPTFENARFLEKLCMVKKKISNPFCGLVYEGLLEWVEREINHLKQNDISSRLLKVNKMERCFEHDTFFITDVRRVRYRWTFTGFLKKSAEEVLPKLEKKLSEATGMDVIVYFKEDEYDMTKQSLYIWLLGRISNKIIPDGPDFESSFNLAYFLFFSSFPLVCTVEPKSSRDAILEYTDQSKGNISAIVLCIASFGTTAWMSSFLLKPNATFDDYLANGVPLFGGLFSILGVSEIATRITAARYGVKLSPSFLIPSIWTGFLGVVNDYESLLPNNKALFDIPVARTASAYLTSLVLVVTAFVVDGSFNGGDNPMYISPGFFSYNSLLSYIQSVIGPYRGDFGNVFPYVVEGVGVPVNPLAFAGIIGVAVTSINLLPSKRMEGGRISQALFGHFVAELLNKNFVLLLLAIGVLDGNVLCLVWFLVSISRSEDETPVKDEITPLGDERRTLGFILQVICILTLFPNIAGRFPFSVSHFFGEMYEVISSSLSYNS